MKIYKKWAEREYTFQRRAFTLVFAGIFFLGILPYVLVTTSARLDARLGLPSISAGALTIILGILLIGGGFLLGWWSNIAQMTIGRGTPLPMMPTQKLLVVPPFTYCRNPMTLGTFLAYLGIAVLIGSISGIFLVLLFIMLLVVYLKLVEEKELEARFGEEYLAYKRNTPFMIPRLPRKMS